MPMTFKHDGKRVRLVAAAARTDGAIVADKLDSGSATVVAGVNQVKAAAADLYWVEVVGVHNLPVPAGVAAGTLLYVPGAPPTAGDSITLTTTAASNTLFCKTLTNADSSNQADCKLLELRY